MQWLQCALTLWLITFTEVLTECSSDECIIDRDPTSITVLPPINRAHDVVSIDRSFIHTIVLKELLLTTDFVAETAKKEFVDLYKELADGKDIGALNKFDREYKQHSAIWWYTCPGYIHDVLIEALLVQNVTSLLRMGFLIQKVHRQLKHIQATADDITSRFIVYRGQGLSYDDYDTLKKNAGGLLSFNTFLPANTNREAAFSNAKRALREGFDTAVVFSITIDPSVDDSTPFACLDDFSYFENSEDEYLFSINTIFRIERLEKVAGRGGILLVNLRLTKINDKQVAQLIQNIRTEIEDTSTMSQIAKLMIIMKQYSTAEFIYNRLLNEVNEDDYNRKAVIHYQIGEVLEEDEKFSRAVDAFERALEFSLLNQRLNDATPRVLLTRIATILQKQNKFDAAIEKFQQGLNLELQAPVINYRRLAKFYNDISVALNGQGKYQDALEYQEKSLATDFEHSPNDSINIGISYQNMADIYRGMNNYTAALIFYEKSLFHLKQSNPMQWETVASVHGIMVQLLKELDRHDEASLHKQQALFSILKAHLGDLLAPQSTGDQSEESLEDTELTSLPKV